jgi:predicted nucleic acid-binding protein
VTWCLDSWAVIAWLRDEQPAAGRVEEALTDGALMSWINAGEVYYLLDRATGRERAEEVLDNLRVRTRLDVATPERVVEAAKIKASFSMAYADAFACATAIAHDATLLTGDPEILHAGGPWSVVDMST